MLPYVFPHDEEVSRLGAPKQVGRERTGGVVFVQAGTSGRLTVSEQISTGEIHWPLYLGSERE